MDEEDSEPSWFSKFVQQLSGIMIIIIIAGGILICLLLFIFAKRQIVRFAIRSPRGINTPGTDASKMTRREINRRLEAIKKITYEPRLLQDSTPSENGDLPCHYYRMRTMDHSKDLEDSVLKKKLGKRHNFESLRSYLISALSSTVDARVIHQYCDLYEGARFNAKPYSEKEYLQFTALLQQLRAGATQLEPKRSTRSGSSILNRESLKSKSNLESAQVIRRPKWTDKNIDEEGHNLTAPLTEFAVHHIIDSTHAESTQV